VTRCQYRWKVQAGDPRTVIWVQRFIPATGPVEDKLMSWEPSGATISPVFTIDPLADPRNGYYTVQLITPGLDALTVRGSTLGYALDETREETVGAFVPINDDDDDYDSANEADWKQAGSTARYPGSWNSGVWYGGTDTDLLPIVLRGGGVSTPPNSAYVLTIPDHVKVWANPDRTSLVGVGGSAATVYVPSGGDTKLYVEGITQKADYLTLSFSHGGTTVVADKILITVFEWGGPLNVPGYSRHRYTAFGAPQGSQWIAPTSGRIMSRPTGDVNDVEILWESGPAVGLCNYYINKDYMWSREVNVVKFEIDFVGAANAVTTRPNETGQHPTNQLVIVSNMNNEAMNVSLALSEVKGPLVNGVRRVAQKFQVGWIQSGTFVRTKARYAIPNQGVDQSCSVQDGDWHVDALGYRGLTYEQDSTLPWYNSFNGGGHISLKAVPRGGWGPPSAPVVLTMSDSPSGEAPRFVIGLLPLVSNAWIFDLELTLAVQTTDAPAQYTVLAKVGWKWDGSGHFDKKYNWTSQGTKTSAQSGLFLPVTTGEQPRFQKWTPINQLLNNRTWN